MTDLTAGLPAFPLGGTVPSGSRALVLTVSDGVSNGTRQDESGMALGDRLAMAGFRVDRQTVPDEHDQIRSAIVAGAAGHDLVVSTGGTGLTPRDVTPQATLAAIDYEVPGLAEAIRAAGRARTPMADLSRGVVGVIGRCLVVNVPGSPRGALESLVALEPTLVHALETLAGPLDHSDSTPSGLPDLLEPTMPTPSVGGALTMGQPDSHTASEPIDSPVETPAQGDMNDPWRDLPRPEDRELEEQP
jgi:molybdopterin adenylyltransferase